MALSANFSAKNVLLGFEKLCLWLNMPEILEELCSLGKIRVKVLMYHSVAEGDSIEAIFSESQFRTTPSNFENQIKYLLRHGYYFATLADYLESVKNKKRLHNKLAVLTLDDGFRSHYKNAFEILKKYNIKATFYPILECLNQNRISWIHKFHRYVNKYGYSGFVNLAKNYLEKRELARCKTDSDITYFFIAKMDSGKRQGILSHIDKEFGIDENKESSLAAELYMNWDEVKKLAVSGMDIGFHTITHMPMTSQYFDISEISKGKRMLEDRLRRKVLTFSYPFGLYSHDGIEALKRSDFMGAVVAQYGNNAGYDAPFLLRRINAGYFDMDEMKKQLLGFSLSNCLKRILKKA